MPAPKGRSYTPTRGPLAGRTFTAPPGRTSGYYVYQQARAQMLGFGQGYRGERTQKLDPLFQALYQRALSAGTPRNRAISDVGAFMRRNPARGGMRKHNAIKFAIDEGWVDAYDEDDDDWCPY